MSVDLGNDKGRLSHLYELAGRISLSANVTRSFCRTKRALMRITKPLILEEQGQLGQKQRSVWQHLRIAFAAGLWPIHPGWQIVRTQILNRIFISIMCFFRLLINLRRCQICVFQNYRSDITVKIQVGGKKSVSPGLWDWPLTGDKSRFNPVRQHRQSQ